MFCDCTTTEIIIFLLLIISKIIILYFLLKKCYKKLIDFEEEYGFRESRMDKIKSMTESTKHERIIKIEYVQKLYDKIHLLAIQQFKIRKGLQLVYVKIKQDKTEDSNIHTELIIGLIERYNFLREKILKIYRDNPEYGPFIKQYISPKLVLGITGSELEGFGEITTNDLIESDTNLNKFL